MGETARIEERRESLDEMGRPIAVLSGNKGIWSDVVSWSDGVSALSNPRQRVSLLPARNVTLTCLTYLGTKSRASRSSVEITILCLQYHACTSSRAIQRLIVVPSSARLELPQVQSIAQDGAREQFWHCQRDQNSGDDFSNGEMNSWAWRSG